MRDLADRLLAVLPRHAAGLTIEHDPHRGGYQTVAGWLAGIEGEPDWPGGTEARERAIASGTLWTCQWYPDTPIGSRWIAAPTLAELLAALEGDRV